ncbi:MULTISPECIES: Hint domain-containing protein [unclassified Kribbella]|uniref:Hint domain-containing protein n=1 Tax=unclassified Kribbella TaxID=2644121 RepID=UPI00301B1CD0
MGVNPAIAGLRLAAEEFDKTGLPEYLELLAELTGGKDLGDCAANFGLTPCAWTAASLTPLKVGKLGRLSDNAADACRVGNSFTGDTLVLMADGTKRPIKDIELGDMVMAADPLSGERGPRKVVDLIRHSGPHTMVAVRLANGTTIDATDRHPFWVANRGAWIDAIDLTAGDILVSADGRRIAVASVGISEQDLTAYNLTVDDLHTYYVLAGQTPVLVHNNRCIN